MCHVPHAMRSYLRNCLSLMMLAKVISLTEKQNFIGNVTWKEKNYPTKQTNRPEGVNLENLCERGKLVIEVRALRFPRQKSQCQMT